MEDVIFRGPGIPLARRGQTLTSSSLSSHRDLMLRLTEIQKGRRKGLLPTSADVGFHWNSNGLSPNRVPSSKKLLW